MINKKRLAMMALAASMILPTNLTYLSVATPILATETQDPKTPLNSTVIVTKDRGDGTSAPCLSQGTYEITTDITLTETNPTWIAKDESVKIYLNGNTLSSSALWVFGLRDGATLEIIGPGTLESTVTDGEGGVLFLRGEKGNLIIRDEVTIKHGASKGWGITISETAPSSTVSLTNSMIEAKQGGITVNGDMLKSEDIPLDSDKLPTITL
ncbi:MAG: hypothetical protein HDR44_02295, partial [Allobaculum sp.]|nr:hypothetical protein [Allobaculum sp.]